MHTTLTIKGTHCTACKSLIEDIASEIPGITSCAVDHKTGVTVVAHGGPVNWAKFTQEVESAGPYTCEIPR